MKITILFPAYYGSPIGGYNVHLNYANLLSGYGHQVSIVFPHYLSGARTWKTGLSTVIWATRLRMKNRPLFRSICLDSRIKVRFTPDLRNAALPKADVLIATAWRTAEAAADAMPDRERKFYIVYDYEYWMTAAPDVKKRIEKTFTRDFRVIATSEAVSEMIEQCGGDVHEKICCGFDDAGLWLFSRWRAEQDFLRKHAEVFSACRGLACGKCRDRSE